VRNWQLLGGCPTHVSQPRFRLFNPHHFSEPSSANPSFIHLRVAAMFPQSAMHAFCEENNALEYVGIELITNIRIGINVRHALATRWPERVERHLCVLVFPESQATLDEIQIWNDYMYEADGLLKAACPNAQLVWLAESKKEYVHALYTDYSAFLWSRGRIIIKFTDEHIFVADKAVIMDKLRRVVRHKLTDAHFVTIYLLSHGMELNGLKPMFDSVVDAAHYFIDSGATLDCLLSNLVWTRKHFDASQLIALIQAHLIVHFHPVMTDQGRIDSLFNSTERKTALAQATKAINALSEISSHHHYPITTSPGELVQILNPCNGDLRFLASLGVLDAQWLKVLTTGFVCEPTIPALHDWFIDISTQCIAALLWSPTRQFYSHPNGTLLPVHVFAKRWNQSHVKSTTPRMGMGHTAEWVRHERDRQGIPTTAAAGMSERTSRRGSFVAVNGREIERAGMGVEFVLKAALYRAAQCLGGGNHVVTLEAGLDAPMNLRNLHRPEDVLPLIWLRVLEYRGYLRRGDDLPSVFGDALLECPTEEGVIWCEMLKAKLIDFTAPSSLFDIAVYLATGYCEKDAEQVMCAKHVRERLRALCECTLAGLFVNEGLGKQRGVAEVINLGLTMLPFSPRVPTRLEWQQTTESAGSSPDTLRADDVQGKDAEEKAKCKALWTRLCRVTSRSGSLEESSAMTTASLYVSKLM